MNADLLSLDLHMNRIRKAKGGDKRSQLLKDARDARKVFWAHCNLDDENKVISKRNVSDSMTPPSLICSS